MTKSWKAAVAPVVLVAGLAAACGTGEPPVEQRVALANAATQEMVVYKTATCGCCKAWVDHMREAGFTVQAVDVEYAELLEKKRTHGVATGTESCHTAVIDGYVVEGHVPADVVARMLRERPDVAGLAVPGMPMGSPGMEGPVKQAYDILALEKDGSTRVYESR